MSIFVFFIVIFEKYKITGWSYNCKMESRNHLNGAKSEKPYE